MLHSVLTPAQSKAVTASDRNVCVSAGAGTGKTLVLVERFLYLVQNKLAHPHEILAITFTEKAAQEMKGRIAVRLREAGLEEARRQLENAYLGTIHSFCARILREHPIEAGIDPDFRVLEEDEANLLKEIAFEELIEARFEEPEIFNLLHFYGEESLRKSVLTVMRKVHTSGLPLKDLAVNSEFKNPINEVNGALMALKKTKTDPSDIAEMEQILSKSVKTWREIEAIREFAERFRRHKSKPEIGAFKDALENWLSYVMEQNASKVKSSFIDFAADFEARYSARKRERSGLDFDDLEREAVKVLSGTEPRETAIRSLYQKHFKFIMVDEFQDTSPIQDRLVELLEYNQNLFIVGDWKQSIYAFRGAEASLFLNKEKLFSSAGDSISLAENFRSRAELLDEINLFFKKLWEDKTFGPLIAARQSVIPAPATKRSEVRPFGALSTGLAAPFGGKAGIQRAENGALDLRLRGDDTNGRAVEFLTVERKNDETAREARAREARVLAARIKELTGSGQYEYGDFAMLFRAADDIFFYEYELRNLGIPYYVVSGRGFYRQLEIRDVISFLEVLDNLFLDIPLAAVLRSPLVQISDDTLFWLSNRSTRLKPPVPLYQALAVAEEIAEIEEKDKKRLIEFRIFFLELLNQKEKWSVSELIERILEHTRYDRYVLSLQQGKRHFANLRKLLEVARELERREPLHLGDFIRYVKGLDTQEVREAEAQVEALEGNVVKLMTVHKAKGLEFKAVCLPNLNRKLKGDASSFLYEPEFGLGFKVFNEITRKFEKTYSYQKIREKLTQNACEESKRLLYVAMTRAKDHLILSGSSKSTDDNFENDAEDPSNWYEWLNQDLAESPHVLRQFIESIPEKTGGIQKPPAEHKKIKTAIESGEPLSRKKNSEAEPLVEFLKPIKPIIFDRIDLPVSAFLAFEKNPEDYRKIYEIGSLEEETAEIEEWLPDEEETGIKPAEFGTVIHKIFEYLVMEPKVAAARLPKLIERFTEGLSNDVKKEIKKFSEYFLKSKIFSEIEKAKARYAEIPFVFRLHGGIIQGTLDLLYQNSEGKWVILDYKTSQVNNQNLEAKAKEYEMQLMFYALACHELLKIPVSSASLYFVRMDQTFDFRLEGIDFGKLKDKFQTIQKSIIKNRKIWAG